MTEPWILRINDKWRLGCDNNQWLVQRRTHHATADQPEKWKSAAYVASTKAVLLRVFREKRVVIDPEAHIAVDALPDNFRGFIQNPQPCPSEGRLSVAGLPAYDEPLSNPPPPV